MAERIPDPGMSWRWKVYVQSNGKLGDASDPGIEKWCREHGTYLEVIPAQDAERLREALIFCRDLNNALKLNEAGLRRTIDQIRARADAALSTDREAR